MIPEGVATLYGFLGLVAPGLLFQLLREKTRPGLEETAFREASRIAFTSLAFTTAAVSLLALLSLLIPSAFVDLATWIGDGSDYLKGHLWTAALSVLLTVALACGLAALTNYWLVRQMDDDDDASIVKTSIWYQLFRGDLPKDKVAWVQAELSDGTRIWGYVDFYTVGQVIGEREISFKGPGLTVLRKGEAKQEEAEKDSYWKYVVVKASDVLMMKITHEQKKGTATATGQ
ncbi:DUF6338 family protein [Kribbella sp. NBC_01510]|uniref:DUF6338 family protein n=1 Tax=Kribbella sp. NBC_01510 TaxID=2903581 RepID=UPI0038678D42